MTQHVYFKLLLFRCNLCKSVSDSYDSLNAKYGMSGQALFIRVNVDELKVCTVKVSIATVVLFYQIVQLEKLFYGFKFIKLPHLKTNRNKYKPRIALIERK